jgi:hypothetical protein
VTRTERREGPFCSHTIILFGPPAGILLMSQATKDFHFVGMPSGTILLKPMSTKIESQRQRPWEQRDVVRRGLPCTAAFVCTDYKVQGRTLERQVLELRGSRTTTIGGQAIPTQCDPYSPYLQPSRCPSLEGSTVQSARRYASRGREAGTAEQQNNGGSRFMGLA